MSGAYQRLGEARADRAATAEKHRSQVRSRLSATGRSVRSLTDSLVHALGSEWSTGVAAVLRELEERNEAHRRGDGLWYLGAASSAPTVVPALRAREAAPEPRASAEVETTTPSGNLRGRGGRGQGAPRRDQLVALVEQHPEGLAAREVARLAGISSAAASQALQDAHRAGLVRHTGARQAARYWPLGGGAVADETRAPSTVRDDQPPSVAGESDQRVEAGPAAGATGEGAPSTWAAEVEAEAGATTSTATEAPPVSPAVLEEARRAIDEDCDDGCRHQRIAPLPRNAYGDVDGRCLDCGEEGFPLEVQGPYDPDDDSRGGEALRRVALVERLLLRDLPAHVRDESFEVRVAFLAGRLGGA